MRSSPLKLFVWLILLWASLAGVVRAADVEVSTLAGLATVAGSSDGTGGDARFYYPFGIAVSDNGNIFVAEYGNSIVRKISPSAVVTTLAGTAGVQGSTDDTGAAASFNTPVGLALDSSENIFVADIFNHTIRKITPTGDVTTFAGTAGSFGDDDGTGAAARFKNPGGIAIDSADNLFVTDQANHTIRKITSAGVVTTFAGTAGQEGVTDDTGAAARFSYPLGITVDSADNLYVTDVGSHTIRKITTGAVVTTLAGNADVAGSADGTGVAANFHGPAAIVADASNNLYVTDGSINQTVRYVTSAGVVTTIAGSVGMIGSTDGVGSEARFSRPKGIGIDSIGDLYLADQLNHTIRKLTLNAPWYNTSWDKRIKLTVPAANVAGDVTDFPVYVNLDDLPDGFFDDVDANGEDIRVTKSDGVSLVPREIVSIDNGALTGEMHFLANGNGLSATTDNDFYIYFDNSGASEPAANSTYGSENVWANGYVAVYHMNDTNGADSSSGAYDAAGTGTSVSGKISSAIDFDGASEYLDAGDVNAAEFANNQPYTVSAWVNPSAWDATNGNEILSKDGGANGWKLTVNSTNLISRYTDGTNSFLLQEGSVVSDSSWSALAATYDGSADLTGFKLYINATTVGQGDPDTVPTPNYASTNLLIGARGESGSEIGYFEGKIDEVRISNVERSAAWLQTEYNNQINAASFYNVGPVVDKDGVGDGGGVNGVSGVVETMAGTVGVTGNTNDTGTAASFNNLYDTAVDSSGNIYVADTANNLIRKITAAGVVTTLAGNGDAESYDGNGTDASFKAPEGITVDGADNIYVADTGSHLIRKISPAGYVVTVAGTGSAGSVDATSAMASFSSPKDLVFNENGDLFIADTGNHIIRKMTPGCGVSTLAGQVAQTGTTDGVGTAALFYNPEGITIDANGNLFVADTYNHTVRKIDTNVNVTTIAGTAGTAGYLDGSGTSANFNYPRKLVLDTTDESIYLVDTNNNVIRKITSGAVVSTFAADSIAGTRDGPLLLAQFNGAIGISMNTDGNFYVADTNNHTLRKIDLYTNGDGGHSAVTGNGNFLNGEVTTLAGAAGISGDSDGTGGAARFSSPYDTAVDTNGNIFVADYGNHTIRKITPLGVVTTFAGEAGTASCLDGTAGDARFNNPMGLAIDADDNLYVADNLCHSIRKITPAAVVTTYAGVLSGAGNNDGTASGARFNYPRDVAIDNGGNLFVADHYNHTIRKISPSKIVTTYAGLAGETGFVDGVANQARLHYPTGVTTDNDGNVYVADQHNHSIRKIVPDGNNVSVVSTLAGADEAGYVDAVTTSARFYYPSKLVLDTADNSLYVTDYYNNVVRKVTSTGTVTTFAGSGYAGSRNGELLDAKFNTTLEGITINADGNFYVSDTANQTIRKIAINPDASGGHGIVNGTIIGTNINGAVTTVAGNGDAAEIDANGILASFNGPYDVALDSNGNLFVADYAAHTIRKMDVNGVVTTFAGQAGVGGATDGTGNGATFYNPTGLAIDADDNLYVTDYSYHTIRKITPAAVVTTYAGSAGSAGSDDGVAYAARFNYPHDVAIDSSGNLYVVDSGSHTIRKIAPNKTVTTLAGSYGLTGTDDGAGSEARFSSPTGLTLDQAGNIYVVDSGNHRIRKVTSTGIVTTVAGSSAGHLEGTGTAAQFYSPSKIVLDIYDNHLYVSDSTNNVIRRITDNGEVTTLTGIGYPGNQDGALIEASFSNPQGLTVDDNGDLYLADYGNNLIRKISLAADGAGSHGLVTSSVIGANGAVTTIAGNGDAAEIDANGILASFNGPHDVVLDSNGNLFVADYAAHTIRKMDVNGVVTTFAGQAGVGGATDGTGNGATFYNPTGIAIDADDNLYVTDYSYHTIRKITPAAVVTTYAGSASSAGSTDGTATGARFNFPYDIAIDSSGNLYVADSGSHTIRKISPNREVTTLAGSAGLTGTADGIGSEARFSSPAGLTVDEAGNIYVVDSANHSIRKISGLGEVTTFAGGTAGYIEGIAAAARFYSPSFIVLDTYDNHLYVSDSTNNVIRRITDNGEVTTLTGTGYAGSLDGTLIGASFSNPKGLTLDDNGDLYLADYGNNLIRKITLDAAGEGDHGIVTATITGKAGEVTTIAGNGDAAEIDANGILASFNGPHDLALDSNGNLFVADYAAHTIRKMDVNGVVTTFAGQAGVGGATDGTGNGATFYNPTGIAIDADDNLYVTDYSYHTIRKITPEAVVTTYAGSAASQGSTDGTAAGARFNYPSDIAIDSSGNLYVADSGAHTIRKISPNKVVTTFAGSYGLTGADDGTGSDARFSSPTSLTVDEAANLYVADSGNHRIRKISPTREVTTFAGSSAGYVDGTGTAAQFYGPSYLVLDTKDNSIQVSDSTNNMIRKISAAGVVSSYTGSYPGYKDGTMVEALFSNPQGLTIDNDGNTYVADYGNNRIRKITVNEEGSGGHDIVTGSITGANGEVTTLAGNGSAGSVNDVNGDLASFSSPYDTAVDSEGNVFVADYTNHLIRKITADGEVTTFAGDGTGAYADGVGTAAQLRNPVGLDIDADDNLYVADFANHVIRKVTPSAVVTTYAGLGGISGADNGITSHARFNNPTDVAMDKDGNLYVVDQANHAIRKIDTSRTVTTIAGDVGVTGSTNGTGNGAQFSSPTGITIDASGSAYITDTGNHLIRKMTSAGAVTTWAGTTSTSGYAEGIANDTLMYSPSKLILDIYDNSLYVTDSTNNVIRKISNTREVSTLTGYSAGMINGPLIDAAFNNPQGISVDDDGNLYVADTNNHMVRKVALYPTGTGGHGTIAGTNRGPSGVVSTLAGNGDAGDVDGNGTDANFNVPYDTAADSHGYVYVADSANHVIRRITQAGVVTTFAGTAGVSGSDNGTGAAARFNTPKGLAVDIEDNVYVADTGNHTIRKITPGAEVTTYAGAGGQSGSDDANGADARFNAPEDLCFTNNGDIYVADTGNHTIRFIDIANGAVTTFAGTAGVNGSTNNTGAAARFDTPTGIAYNNIDNTIYVADSLNHTIRKITPAKVVTTLAGTAGVTGYAEGTGADAQFETPTKLSYKMAGNSLYVVDADNHAVRKVSMAGVVTNFTGSDYTGSIDGTLIDAQFYTPSGISVDADGNFYIADKTNNRIRKITVNANGGLGTGGGGGGSGIKEVHFR